MDKNNNNSGTVNSIIGQGSEVKGEFKFNDVLRIDGVFSGELKSDGKVIIGELSQTIIGTAKESKTSGQTVEVIIDGVSDVHLGLTSGSVYYVDGNGTLTTSVTSNKIGFATSATELILADPFW